jgi:hypothetical protein
MAEREQLQSARKHLAAAEAAFRSADGLADLEEGLLLLAEVMAGGAPSERTIAQNLASTYTNKFYGIVRRLLDTDRGIPEPELEHFFTVILALDHAGVDLPQDARTIKIAIARTLVDRYFEGYSPAAKQQALERLTAISDGKAGA